MRITGITHTAYSWPRPRPITNGRYTYRDAGVGVVRIETDEGITGTGLTHDPLVQDHHAVHRAFIDAFRPMLVGQDPLDHERLWAELWQPKLVGRRGLSTRAISAIDIALWDLKARVAGMPIHKLIGGARDRIPAYVAGGYYEEGKGLDELAEEMRDLVASGARAVKMKIGGLAAPDDTERVRIARDAIGPDVKLMVDANGAYRAHEAIDMARRIEPHDVYWFEEPVMPDDYEGQAQVARSTTIAIASGENEATRYGFRDLIAHRSASILNVDAQVAGGVTEFLKIAALAQAHDLPIAPHGTQEIHVQLVTGIANGLILEYYADHLDPMWNRFVADHVRLEDGYVRPSDRPGFGIDIDEDAVRDLVVLREPASA